MAVVSISRIQIRRGKENSGSGLPQLASGELGWAIDTQHLYIGNGSVSEGAPAVGNTRILTSNDNLFSLVNTYTYRPESSIAGTATRDLQDRLDDRVSVRAFGVLGDGSDCTQELQTAIYQLYLNTDSSDQAILHMEPGTYVISDTIYLPKNTKLIGAGKGKTNISVVGDQAAFLTVSDLSTPGNPVHTSSVTTNNQPTNIHLAGMTISFASANTVSPLINLFNCRNSTVEDIEFQGNFDALNKTELDVIPNAGIKLTSDSMTVYSGNNIIRNCSFNDLCFGIMSDDYSVDNVIHKNSFYLNIYGISFGNGVQTYDTRNPYPRNNVISENDFKEIYANGILVKYGVDNVSRENHFYNVGNRYSGPADIDYGAYGIIKFAYSGNISVDDYFERSYILSTGSARDGLVSANLVTSRYTPDVVGPVFYEEGYTKKVSIPDSTSPQYAFRLAADSIKTYEIEYVYESTIRTFKRFGTLTVTIEPTGQTVDIIDDYDITGSANYAENIVWTTSFVQTDTLAVSTTNPGDAGTLQFRARVKS